MDSKDIAVANMLQNQAKKILDYCKLDVNSIFADIPSNFTTVDLEVKNFNPGIDYDESIVYKVKKDNQLIGDFYLKNKMFIPMGYRSSSTPEDKEHYDRCKQEFDIKNCSGIKITDTNLTKLIKRIDSGKIDDNRLINLIDIIANTSMATINKTFRLSSKLASDSINQNDYKEIIELITKKTKNTSLGILMYQIFGYQGQSEVSYKINQSQKDKLINIILNDNGTLRDKDEYEAMLDKLSFDERLSLVKPLNTLYTDAGNLVKASPELKENEQYFSASISYELSLKTLTEDLKFRKKDVESLLWSCKELSAQCDQNFEYMGQKNTSKSIYMKNDVFTDLRSKEFDEYCINVLEQKEILSKIETNSIINNISQNNNYNKSPKLRIK